MDGCILPLCHAFAVKEVVQLLNKDGERTVGVGCEELVEELISALQTARGILLERVKRVFSRFIRLLSMERPKEGCSRHFDNRTIASPVVLSHIRDDEGHEQAAGWRVR